MALKIGITFLVLPCPLLQDKYLIVCVCTLKEPFFGGLSKWEEAF